MGLNTKIALPEVEAWVFEYYCNLDERLHGQRVRIKSLWTNEAVASMYIFYDPKFKQYVFRDFSSGKAGDCVSLVKYLFDLKTTAECMNRIKEDYENYLLTNDKLDFVIKDPPKYYISSFEKRKWHKNDAKYWLEYGIGSKLLQEHNICPLKEFAFAKESDGKIEEIKFRNELIYGYFKSNGVLCKIYRPKCTNLKFIKVSDYIQGSEQLKYKHRKLIIASSMKDLLALKTLKFDVEAIAPDSETSIISKAKMASYLHMYDDVYTLFDNDDCGHRYMDKYQELYGIKGIYLNLEKDLARSVKIHGSKKVRHYLMPIIKS